MEITGQTNPIFQSLLFDERHEIVHQPSLSAREHQLWRQRSGAQQLIESFDEAAQIFARFDSPDEENELSVDAETSEELSCFPSFEYRARRFGRHHHLLRIGPKAFANLILDACAGRDDFRS